MTTTRGGFRWSIAVLLAGTTALLVLVSRGWLIARVGSPVPYLDQWDAEAVLLYGPLHDGVFHGGLLLEPHTLHRPVLPQAWNAFWFVVFGGWDPLGQMVVNTFFPALLAGMVTFAAGLWTRDRRLALLASLIAVVTWAFPWAHQNTLWGFQSQFLALVLLSIVGVAGALSWPRSRLAAGVGVLALGLAPLTMSAGVLASLAVAGVSFVAWRTSKPSERRGWARVCVVACLGCLWGYSWSLHAAGGGETRVQSVGQWLQVFGAALAWPWPSFPGWSVGVILPLAGWLVGRLRRDERIGPEADLLAGLALWSVLSAAALAWVRGGAAVASYAPVSRYLDSLLPGIFAAGVLLGCLPGRWARTVLLLWLVGVVAGVVYQGGRFASHTLPELEARRTVQLEAAHAEVQSGYPGEHLRRAGVHPDAATLARVLGQAVEGHWLPPELDRPPDGLWQRFGSLGTEGTADNAGVDPRAWRSPELPLSPGRWWILTKNVEGGRAVDTVTGKDAAFADLGLAGGGWRRWGFRAEGGAYRLELAPENAGAALTVLWPRPLRASAYGIRQVLTVSGPAALAVTAWWLLLAVWLVRPQHADAAPPPSRAEQP